MSPSPNRPIQDLYLEADSALSPLLDSLSAEQWDAPSPCDGWRARDVVGHLIEAQRSFLSERGFDLGPAPGPDADPVAAWRAHRDQVVDLLTSESVAATGFEGHFGSTTVGEALGRFYVFDMVAHRWDLARAAGCDETFTAAELDALEAGIAGFGPALYMEGICRSGVEAPAGADRQTRVLAALGRTA